MNIIVNFYKHKLMFTIIVIFCIYLNKNYNVDYFYFCSIDDEKENVCEKLLNIDDEKFFQIDCKIFSDCCEFLKID